MSSVQAVIPRSAQAGAVCLLLAGSLCLLPFLLPYHQPPILSFQAEWMAAALGIAAMLAALGARGSALVALPLPARLLAAFALLVAAQTLVASPVYVQLPLLGALHALYAVLLFWLGAQLAASTGIGRAATVLATCLLAGALANAAAGMIQFYGRPALLQDFVAELRYGPAHNGAYGNIAQPNLYANYLALGATALAFLWQQQRLRAPYALAAALLLAWAGALSGSRSALLYALWFVVLASLSARLPTGAGSRRLRSAAFGLAAAMLAAQLAVPWLNATLDLGPANQGAFERMLAISGGHTEARGPAWLLALRVFTDAPLFGAGIGEFAGAVFELGLAPEMALGEVWNSPHNLPLHLLAETGAPAAALALAALGLWCWQTGRRYVAAPEPSLWWIIAAAGIELIHSMVEFPLWYAHFLGVTALVMGLAAAPTTAAAARSRPRLALAAGLCVLLAFALALLLRDYLRLDATRATGTSLTLASRADTERDVAVMQQLARGALAPLAERWMLLGAPLDRGDLATRVAMSQRVARTFPANTVVVRRAVYLAFDGQAAAARAVLLHALHSFPHRCKATVFILQQARAADPGAIEPLLALTRSARPECN